MLRSLFSGISGLRSHQTMLDVTANNIANVNTAGYKASATQFQDTLSQVTQGAGGPQANVGGTNPAQVGLGVQVAGISTNFTQGSSQATGRPTDLMISGDGFFVTRMGNETVYTRAGSFDFDAQGRLSSPDGGIVQGWTAVNGQIPEGGAVSDIMRPTGAVSAATASATATLAGNLPSDTATGVQLKRDVETFDEIGNSNTLTLTFTRTGTGWAVTGKDSTPAGAATVNVTTLTQNNDGTLTADAMTPVNGVDIDLAGLSGFSGVTTVSMTADGRAAGSLDSFSLGSDGTLIGAFSNSDIRSMGRIALANFVNPPGLEKAGSSSYRATVNSGGADLGGPGVNGLGSLVTGTLEMSNVDLSQEFTNLIVAQRGFQANARIITTSDEVLQELTNLKR